jgi:uncharacterized protein with GYD domain
MPTYVTLINWTDQGIRTVKDSPKRLEAAKKELQKLGGEVKSFYMTQGAFDAILILDVPSDEALAKFLLKTGSAGNVRTTTLKAYPEADYRKIIEALG